MPWWLNWRIWLAVAIAASGAYLHHLGYVSGKAEVQSVFEAYKTQSLEQALAAQAAQTLKEQSMQAANEKVNQDYDSLKTATATAVRALDRDRMRLQATLAAYRGATGKDSGTGQRVDADTAIGVLSSCVNEYSGLAEIADQQADTLKALQEYVTHVIER